VPTLLLFGKRDADIPTPAVRGQAARAGALELEIVPETGHFIAEEQPKWRRRSSTCAAARWRHCCGL